MDRIPLFSVPKHLVDTLNDEQLLVLNKELDKLKMLVEDKLENNNICISDKLIIKE